MTAATADLHPGDKDVIRSTIPARIDRLPWNAFHTRLVIALGVAWVLDGLEITVAANIGPTMATPLHMSSGAVGWGLGGIYLVGEVIGAIFFGRLSDAWGRRKLFMITLGVYLVGSGLTALTWNKSTLAIGYLWACRIIAGAGI